MKKDKIIYWTSTVFIVVALVLPAIFYFNDPMAIEGIKELGFPNYFRIELTIAKIIGGLVLIIPVIPARFKEWAYVGFGIDFISAFIANIVVLGFAASVPAIVSFGVLAVSYIYFHKMLGGSERATVAA